MVSVKKNTSGEGQLVNKTAYGDVHKVEGFTPTAQKVASDTAIVNQEAQKTGKNYIDSQKDLPDVIVVGGSGGGSSNPAGQGTVTEMANLPRPVVRLPRRRSRRPRSRRRSWGARRGTGRRLVRASSGGRRPSRRIAS